MCCFFCQNDSVTSFLIMENYSKKFTEFHQYSFSFISQFFKPLFDINWFLKPNFKQENDLQLYIFKSDQKAAIHPMSLSFRKRSSTKSGKTVTVDEKPCSVDECWQKCSWRSKKLEEDIKRLETLIEELADPHELADLQKGRSSNRSWLGKEKNKKVQATIPSSRGFISKTTETDLPSDIIKNRSFVCPCISRSESITSENEIKQYTKSKSKSKDIQTLPSNDGNFLYTVSQEQQSESCMLDVPSHFQENSNLQEYTTTESDSEEIAEKNIKKQESLIQRESEMKKTNKKLHDSFITVKQKFPHKGDGETGANVCPCSCATGKVHYHNYITITSAAKEKKDCKVLQNIIKELERQKEELEQVKDTLYKVMQGKKLPAKELDTSLKPTKREVNIQNYSKCEPVKRYKDVGVVQTRNEFEVEPVREYRNATSEFRRENVKAKKPVQT